jgi:hypothetical protein
VHFVWDTFIWPVLGPFSLAIEVVYILALRKALLACRPENRIIRGWGWLWVEILPIVGIIWQFVNVFVISRSLGREYRSRDHVAASPAENWGLAAFGLQVLGITAGVFANQGYGLGSSPSSAEAAANPLWTALGWLGTALVALAVISWLVYWGHVTDHRLRLNADLAPDAEPEPKKTSVPGEATEQ